MTGTYTPLGFSKQGTGDNNNVWGVELNESAIQLIDEAIRGKVAFSLSGPKTLTSQNGGSNEARCMFLDVTGGTGGTILIPSYSKLYVVRNGSSGNVIISTGGATTVTLEAGDLNIAISDGAAVRQLQIAGLNLRDYIAAAGFSDVELPAQAGNAGKFVRTDGTNATWQQIQTADIGDFQTEVRRLVLVNTLIFRS